MVEDQRNSGFALLEVLMIVVLLQVLFSFAWPSFQRILSHYHCQHLSLDLQKQLQMARVRALLTGQSQVFHPPNLGVELSWHGFNRGEFLVFEANTLSNRVNGYFQIQCSTYFGYRLWINRLGHMRLESLDL